MWLTAITYAKNCMFTLFSFLYSLNDQLTISLTKSDVYVSDFMCNDPTIACSLFKSENYIMKCYKQRSKMSFWIQAAIGEFWHLHDCGMITVMQFYKTSIIYKITICSKRNLNTKSAVPRRKQKCKSFT